MEIRGCDMFKFMKKVAANILKATVGKLPTLKQSPKFEDLSWYNIKVLKHQEDHLEKIFHFGLMPVHYRRPYELLHAFTEIFVRGIYRFRAATDAPLIIDCGANIGMSVLNFKRQYPKAKVIAFEPDHGNFQLLSKNVTANDLPHVTLKQAAVWTANGSISFSSEASEASHIAADGSGSQVVTAFRLADLLAAEERIDFLKIDIEGAEWPVIQDCAPVLGKVQHLFLEYHGKTSETYKLAGIMNILQDAGFSVYVQNAADALSKPFLNKTTNTIYDVQLNLYCFKS